MRPLISAFALLATCAALCDLALTRQQQTPRDADAATWAPSWAESEFVKVRGHADFDAAATVDETTEESENGKVTSTQTDHWVMIPLRAGAGAAPTGIFLQLRDPRPDAKGPLHLDLDKDAPSFTGVLAPPAKELRDYLAGLEKCERPLRTLRLDGRAPSMWLSWTLLGFCGALLALCLLPRVAGGVRGALLDGDWTTLYSAPGSRITGGLLTLGGAGLLGLALWLRLVREHSIGDDGALFVFPILGLLLLGAALATDGSRLQLSPAGVTLAGLFTQRLERLPWSELTAMKHSAVRNRGITFHKLILTLAGGGTRKLRAIGEGFGDAAARLEAELSARLLPELQRRLDAGETLDFGAVKLTRDAVSVRNLLRSWREVPLAGVKSVELKGLVVSFTGDDKAGGAAVPYTGIENLELLLQLSKRAIARARAESLRAVV